MYGLRSDVLALKKVHFLSQSYALPPPDSADPHIDPHLQLAARVVSKKRAAEDLRKAFLCAGKRYERQAFEGVRAGGSVQAAVCDKCTAAFTHTNAFTPFYCGIGRIRGVMLKESSGL